MARNLDPNDVAFGWALRRGAIIVLPDVKPGKGGKPGEKLGSPRVLRFQYNPETITRTRTGEWEQRKNQKVPTPTQKSDQSNFQGGGLFTKSETISMKLVFDVSELLLRDLSGMPGAGGGLDPLEVGVLPELAVLEQIAIAEPPKNEDQKKDDKKGDKLNVVRPKELLLVLGPRYFPVIVTSLTITEKRFSPSLVPVRAEVDMAMQVMEATETSGDQAIKAAFDQLMASRQKNAEAATAQVALDVNKGQFAQDLNEVVGDAIAKALRTAPGGS
jgi:hypothetical protein